jgi:hypothetical protein
MADKKITQLTEETSPLRTDLLVIVTDPTGSAETQKVEAGKIADLASGATLAQVYPVGSIYITVVATNPATVFGFGTWVAFGAGKTLVGLNAAETEFDTVEETGGAKTHTLSAAEMPAHTHSYTYKNTDQDIGGSGATGWRDTTSANTGSAGSGNAHNNLQPYIVVYMFKRTA